MIRVLLADDQPLVRMGLRTLVDSEPDLACVAEAGDGRGAVTAIRESRPDVVLLDIRMPLLDGLGALGEITDDPALEPVRVVMLTTFGLEEYVFEALRLGASGFLLKDAEPAEILRAIRVAHAGDALLSPAVTRQLVSAFTAGAPAPASTPQLIQLTDREREVMALVGEGLSNSEIAERLVISPATARTHVSRTMVKLHARDRAQLVVFAYQSGLVRGA